ncbi:MAG: hypothetical protein Q8P41_17285 [Pseudomonadota bacterium]|nr:hypothetical protein [Pseudomonadota bacterium]
MIGLLALLACTAPDDTGLAAADPETRAVVMSTLSFGRRADDGTAWGFDVDGRVSDAGDDEGCGHADLVDADGLAGIDSAFSGMVPALEATEAGAVEGLVQDSLLNGELLLLVEVSGVDDPLDDDCVDVRILRGSGTPMIGTDGGMLDGQTFALAPDAEPAVIECVPLVAGSVRAGPFALTLDFQVLDVALAFHMTDASLRLDLSEDGRTGWGYFGGSVPTADILVIVDEGDLADIADLVRGLVNAAADLEPNDEDTCDALSVVFEYGATEAFIYEGAPTPGS